MGQTHTHARPHAHTHPSQEGAKDGLTTARDELCLKTLERRERSADDKQRGGGRIWSDNVNLLWLSKSWTWSVRRLVWSKTSAVVAFIRGLSAEIGRSAQLNVGFRPKKSQT